MVSSGLDSAFSFEVVRSSPFSPSRLFYTKRFPFFLTLGPGASNLAAASLIPDGITTLTVHRAPFTHPSSEFRPVFSCSVIERFIHLSTDRDFFLRPRRK